jgi:organic radical activating enzyme
MIPIMEAFYSVQGEGDRVGYPSVFLRTGGCNFSCAGFGVKYEDPKTGETRYGCDSFYSVDRGFSKEWEYYEGYMEIVDLIDDQIPKFSKHNLVKPDIVITGGEPLIYWKNNEFQKVIAHYISRGHHVTIETNASLDIEFTREYQKQIQFSMSVKLSNSGEAKHKRINIENITQILESTNNSYLKFVIDKSKWKEDYKEIKEILLDIPYYVNRVYLMPLGDTIETLDENAKFTMEKCIEKGFLYSDRIHIRIWDNLPGV